MDASDNFLYLFCVWLCMFHMCMFYNCCLAYLRLGLAFFDENRLATLRRRTWEPILLLLVFIAHQ